MNILLSALIAIICIFALKRHNEQQENGLGNKRFLIAIAVAVFPYIDRVFSLLGQSIELAYQNNFLWSLILTPIYAAGFTAGFKFFFGDKVELKYLFPSILGTMLTVIMFNFLGNDGVALFSPFSNYKYAAHLLHDFDFTLFLISAFAVALIFAFKNYRRDIARYSFLLIIGYILVVFSFSLKATSIANDYAQRLKIEPTEIYTLAQPLSIFNWRIMIFTKDHKIHDSFITLKSEQDSYDHDKRTNRVAQLYRTTDKAVWRIYRQINPNYEAQYHAIMENYGKKAVLANTLKFSILKDAINYKQYRCLRFKDLRTEGIRKSLKGNVLFCQNPKTKDIKILSGTKKSYEEITWIF
tara:strand:+ start:508 stop:1569 length:1062 start_codon:yes stop_codon:yes gene_type:complete